MIDQSSLWSTRGEWKEMSVENKLTPPKGSRLKMGGSTGHLIAKCIVATVSLEWNERPQYCRNLSLCWSPWGPILQLFN